MAEAKSGGTRQRNTERKTGTSKQKSDSKNAKSRRKAELGLKEIGHIVAEQLPDFIHHDIEQMVSAERGDEGWIVQVQVLEIERVPQTTDVLSTYEVQLAVDGTISSYRRLHRYTRAQIGEG